MMEPTSAPPPKAAKEAKVQARAKPVPKSWPPWVWNTAATVEMGRKMLPPGHMTPAQALPDMPSSLGGSRTFTRRLKKHMIYRYSERAVRAASFRPERFTKYCLGRPVQVAAVHVRADVRCVCRHACARARAHAHGCEPVAHP